MWCSCTTRPLASQLLLDQVTLRVDGHLLLLTIQPRCAHPTAGILLRRRQVGLRIGRKIELESQGYTQVTDVSSTPEGVSAKAMKGGKAVALVIDSSGNIKESQVGP